MLEACLDLGGIVPREEEAQPFMVQLLANAYRESNDKKRARVNAMRYFLSRFDYEGKDPEVVGTPDPQLVQRGRDAVGD